MNAAAPPPAEPALPDLPADLAEALDARGEVFVRHPRTGFRLRLVPDAGTELTAEQEELRASIDRAIAQADAGLGMTTEEVRAEMARRHPELRDR